MALQKVVSPFIITVFGWWLVVAGPGAQNQPDSSRPAAASRPKQPTAAVCRPAEHGELNQKTWHSSGYPAYYSIQCRFLWIWN